MLGRAMIIVAIFVATALMLFATNHPGYGVVATLLAFAALVLDVLPYADPLVLRSLGL